MIEMLADAGEPLTFGAFVSGIAASKASTARLLQVLRERGYAMKDEASGRYRPGPRISPLRGRETLKETLRREVRPVLCELRERTGNTAVLFHWNGAVFEVLAKEMHPESVSMQPVGNVVRGAAAVPWGWLVLSYAGDAARRAALAEEKLPRGKAKSVARHIRHVEAHGYAYDDDGAFRRHVRRLAAPVFDHTGSMVAGMAIGGNSLSIPEDRVEPFGRLLKAKARALSRQVGWREGMQARAELSVGLEPEMRST
jgi:DNA-binding IclR family transcriptional regulator